MRIRLAELNIELRHRFDYTARMCRPYLAEFDTPDIVAEVSDGEIEAERRISTGVLPAAYAEFICLYRAICVQLTQFDAFVFHASVLECDGQGVAFTAPSGTGKSTHTALWLKHFGDRARVINGDKPIMRFIGDKLFAFGTPWCGKERWGCNAATPLAALCFVERNEKNFITRVDDETAIARLMPQILMPQGTADKLHFLELLDRTVTTVPMYRLCCNMEEEAAVVAHAGIFGGANEQ